MVCDKAVLLIVEPDPELQRQLSRSFCDDYQIRLAEDRRSALGQLRRETPAIVLLDLGLPPESSDSGEGFQLLSEILETFPDTKIVVVTGADDRQIAVRSIALGAYDFFRKPLDSAQLGLTLQRAARVWELERSSRLSRQPATGMAVGSLLTASPEMLAVCRTVARVAPTDVSTLLLGESGTGKELLARALHQLSPRREGPFVAINCAAIPDNLLESELFGYERGAFTGAVKQTPGRIELAAGGTLFLDEIGDLPGGLQAKLLRFLQERLIERIGGREPIAVDLRVVSATHRDLHARIGEGRFREDLYYRLSEVNVAIPRLADRTGDAVLLARVFLKRYAEELRKPKRGLARDAVEAIEVHSWPGNVRELENRIKRALILSERRQLSARDLELPRALAPLDLSLRSVRERAEHHAVVRALAHTNNNISRAAELLGITRPTLYALLSRHGVRA